MHDLFLEPLYLGCFYGRYQSFGHCPNCKTSSIVYSFAHTAFCVNCGYRQHSLVWPSLGLVKVCKNGIKSVRKYAKKVKASFGEEKPQTIRDWK